MLNKIKKIIYHLSFIIHHFLEYGFYLFIFFLPWQTQLVLQSGMYKEIWSVDYWTIGIYGVDILLLVLLLVFVFLSLRAKRSNPVVEENNFNNKTKNQKDEIVRQQPQSVVVDSSLRSAPFRMTNSERWLWGILSGLDLALLVSIFFAPDKILALYKYGIFLLGIGLFWLVIKLPFNKIKAAYAFFAALVLQSFLAFWQFFTQSAFGNKWLGMAEHLPSTPGSSVIETLGADGTGERWLRAYGSLSHPNILGGLLVIGLLIIIFAIINNQRKPDKKSDPKFIIYHLSFIILLVGLLLSFSRAAYLCFLVGILIFFIFYLFKKNWLAIKRLGGIILLSAVVFGVIFSSYQNLFITRAGGQARLEVKSTVERKIYLDNALAMLKNNWWRPRGLGNYTVVLSRENKDLFWYNFQPVHNTFLLVWLEAGIWGILFFLFFLGYLFWQSFKNKNILGLSILAILCIIMSLDHWLWSLPFGTLFFWLAAGIIAKDNFLKQTYDKK
ncbi:MAG: O-antigen ligase family protein [Patescibacteria group bacterium]|jgi:O-antigen ligase